MFKNIYTNNLKLAVFDIESMGLNPATDIVISASFLDEDGEGLRQYFCEDPNSEFLLLSRIAEEFKNLDAIITYNGQRFDIPFIKTRAKKYSIDIPDILNIDVYRLLRSYWPVAKSMPSLSQSSVEYAMGLTDHRTDTINGAECIPLYNDYLLNGNMGSIDKILLHNADDVRQLCKISNKLSFLPFHRVAFENGYIIKFRQDYPGASDISIEVSNTDFSDFKISSYAKTITGMQSVDIQTDEYHLEYDAFTGAAKLDLFLKKIDSYKYIDLDKMPVSINDYVDMAGFNNGYLILVDGKTLNYLEINTLISELFKEIF